MKYLISIIFLIVFSIGLTNAQHLKKDGTPDMRYKENKIKYSSPSPIYKSSVPSSSSNSSSVQCSGITKSGSICKNMTKNKSGLCYIHIGQDNNPLQEDKNINSVHSSNSSKFNQQLNIIKTNDDNQSNYSIADEIRKLKTLLDEDIITKEEFEILKKKLLSK